MFAEHPVNFDFCEDYNAITTESRLILGTASQLIISLYSCFDILSKIAYELENIQDCSSSYKRLSSRNILFGDKNKIKKVSKSNTIFDNTRELSIIVNLRNELVHNAAWEMHPKIFIRTKNNVLIDKTIYLPDFNEDGNLIRYKNRKRFFAQGKELNKELPKIFFSILSLIENTIDEILIKHS